MEPALLLGLGFAALGATAVTYGAVEARRAGESPEAYLASLEEMHQPVPDDFEEHLAQPFLTRVLQPFGGRLLDLTASLTPREHRLRIQRSLSQAGLASTYRAEEIIAGQVVAGLAGLLVALALAGFGVIGGLSTIVAVVLFPAVAQMVPVAWLNHRVSERQAALRSDLPDTLDLLAISVEAGVGLEGAMEVVCQRFQSPLADELSRTLREMELGLTRRDALQNLKRRTEVPELANFVVALIQADALGMPIGRVLKTQAGEMRVKRRQWARERASKLPVKILFPLVMCIFPAVLVVVLGPAASQIGQALK